MPAGALYWKLDPTVIHKIIILKSFRYLKLLKLKRVACQTDAFYKNKRSKAASLYAPLKQNIYEVVWWELCPRPWSLFSPEEHRTTRYHTEPRGTTRFHTDRLRDMTAVSFVPRVSGLAVIPVRAADDDAMYQ